MNSLNLRQVCGGDTIKQADFGSELAFELLDEQYVKFREPLGEAAKVILKKDNIAIYQTSVTIVNNTVSFKFDKILPVGSYVLEIIVGDYVFPSNNRVIITVEQTYGDFEPEYLVKVSYEELKADVDDVKTKIEQFENTLNANETNVNQELLTIGKNQVEMTKRIETLESREDHDTIYDDTEIKERLSALEKKEDKDTIYNDTEIKQSIANVDNKVSGLSEKVTALEKRPIVDTALTKRVEALERKEDKDTVYDDAPIIKRIETLEQREDKDTVYDDSDLKHRVTELENRPVAEPYNDIEIKDRLTVLESKQDKDTVYDDTSIKERISALEDKPDNDTIYDDSNLKARIVELETALNTLVRKRPPMSFYIDRSDMSKMKAVFDNGCVMINFAGAVYNYFYGYPGGHDGRSFHYSNLPGNLIKVSVGIVGVDSLKEESISNAIYYCNDTKILNPIYDSSQFNFDELVIREPTDKIDYKLACQRNFVKIAYEIGALTEAEIIKLGATKK